MNFENCLKDFYEEHFNGDTELACDGKNHLCPDCFEELEPKKGVGGVK